MPTTSPIGPILTGGFGTAIAVWCAWYITHLPWVTQRGLTEQAALPLLLAVWFLGMVLTGRAVGRGRGWWIGLGAGFVAAVPGLLVLGTKTAQASPGFENLKPGNLLIAIGFLALGAVLGLVGGSIGGALSRPRQSGADWLFRFAVAAATAVLPLLVIGGLVTSTNSGMAVPDWPNTFGSNMFLYPLGPRAAPGVFLEHAHRLFGSLVGLTTLVLMLYTMAAEQRRWLKILAAIAFGVVVVQGALGGFRVIKDERVLALIHGVLAQLTFGLLCSVAVYLAPSFKAAPSILTRAQQVPGGKSLKFFSTGLVHSATLQLIFGAMYRHFRDSHSLWTHIGFSMVVLLFGLLSGFSATSLKGDWGGLGRILRRTGTILLAVVLIQFTLGWATFALGGKAVQADTTTQALLRTAHQANGGLLLGMAVVQFIWARRLVKLTRAV